MITEPRPEAGTMLSRVHRWLRQRPHWQWQLLAHLLALGLLVNLLLGVPAAADGVAMLLKGSGLLALQLLLASLCISPLLRLLHCSPLLAARRPLGLWAFASVCLHLQLLVYLLFALLLLAWRVPGWRRR